MDEIVGLQFRTTQKICYFNGFVEKFEVGELVVCRTVNGLEIGKIFKYEKIKDCQQLDEAKLKNVKEILRKATANDLQKARENLEFEKKVFSIGKAHIKKENLKMNLVLVVSSLERSKVIFFFTAEERVDFRELVKKLAFNLKVRVELRQIGIRDEAKILCGIGICGRPFCCSSFLQDFYHVSIKMAKEQNLSLNPKKISGCCGKLMCCLQYEQSSYNFLNKVCPKIGSVVMSPDGEGVVVNGNPLTGEYRLQLDVPNEDIERVFKKESLKILKESNGRGKNSKKIKNLKNNLKGG